MIRSNKKKVYFYFVSLLIWVLVGEPFPKFNTDEDRSFFEVELFIHRAFNIKQSIPVNLQNVKWDLDGINILLNSMVDKSELEPTGGIVGNQASNQVDLFQITDNQYKMIFELLDSNQVNTIARGIAEKHISILLSSNMGFPSKTHSSG